MEEKNVRSVELVLSILENLAGNGEMGVTEIAKSVLDKKLDHLFSIIKEEVQANMEPTEIKVADLPKVEVGKQHELFEKIVTLVQLRENIMLVGPAGSGKTTVCKNAAKACGLKAEAQSVGIQTTKTDLLGYMDANGRYVPSILRRLYEHGGLYVLDEIDGGNANVLTILNSLLDNGAGSFPDGVVDRHPDFVCIATANTYGRGADRQYVGRNQLDAATLDRFIVLNFDYDYEFEKAISPNKEWTGKVQKLRKAIFELQERVLCTPRVSIKGAAMLANGFTEQECLNALVFKGVHSDTRKKIMARGWV
jgi:MoxR-like ATPase